MSTKIEQFAKQYMGITLTQSQLDIIEAVADGKMVLWTRAPGAETTKRVMNAYLKDGLKR